LIVTLLGLWNLLVDVHCANKVQHRRGTRAAHSIFPPIRELALPADIGSLLDTGSPARGQAGRACPIADDFEALGRPGAAIPHIRNDFSIFGNDDLCNFGLSCIDLTFATVCVIIYCIVISFIKID
jgi:hypothetical protein